MKRQNTVIPYFLLLSLIVLQECKEIRGCDEKCKNKTNECLLKTLSFSNSFIATNTSSTPTGFTATNSEVEPNDTFQDSYMSSANGLGVDTLGNTDVVNANILLSSDIDIFDVSSGIKKTEIYVISQINNLDKVTCNIYLKNNTFQGLQTPTSIPDSSFIFQGILNPSFSFSYVDGGAIVYLICSGAANTPYTVQVKAESTSSSASSLALTTSYTSASSCKDATKACESKCNRGL